MNTRLLGNDVLDKRYQFFILYYQEGGRFLVMIRKIKSAPCFCFGKKIPKIKNISHTSATLSNVKQMKANKCYYDTFQVMYTLSIYLCSERIQAQI